MKKIIDQSIDQHSEQSLTEAIHRLMRTLRRRPSAFPHHSRGYRRLLRALNKSDGASAGELSELLGIRPASLAELLSKTEAKGLIRRVRDDADHRVLHFYLEESGQQAIREMKARVEDEEIYLDILSEEETTQLISLCNKLTEGLEKKWQVSAEDPGQSSPHRDLVGNTAHHLTEESERSKKGVE